MRNRSRWILTAIAFFVVMWAAAIYWGSHSEGFQLLQGRIRASPDIQSRVGNVRQVALPIFGLYREKFADSDRWVRMTVEVEGDRGSVTVRAVMRKRNDVWKITESSIGGQQIDLNRD